MRSAGVAVHMGQKKRPAAAVVVLEGRWESATLVTWFALTSTTDDLATQLRDLSAGLRSGLSGASIDRVVVRRADTPRASNQEGPRLRLLAEGALGAAAKELLDDVVILKAREIALRTPAGTKDALTAIAKTQLPDAPSEAAEAALAGLTI